MKIKYLLSTVVAISLISLSNTGMANQIDGNAVLGAAIGGAAGAAIGSQMGGRNGAIVGGAIGGGTGAAVGSSSRRSPPQYQYDDRGYQHRAYGREYDRHEGKHHHEQEHDD